MELTTLQRRTVEDIVKFYGKEREVHFKAPTGSGKTLMATNVISQIMNNNPSEKFIFVIATISSSDLPQSFEDKINQYKNNLPFGDFEVEYIESPSSSKNKVKDFVPQINIVRNKVYIFGKATFGKGRIFTEQEVLSDFIRECKQQGYKIVYVRDEAHIGGQTSDAGVKTFETLMQNNADFTLKMTATFDNKSIVRRVELREMDLKDGTKNDGKYLIKCNAQIINEETVNDAELIDLAIIKFKEIKEEYSKLDYLIKPAMLIQVDSEPTDDEKKAQFHSTLKLLKEKLSENNLSWVQYFGGNDKDFSNIDNKDFTLFKITRHDDPTDCIIFKIGPATGWDIPRACMLLQLRNVCSTNLSIQTIGRIKRNPYRNLAKNEITDKYYIFTNEPQNNRDYNVYEYKVKKEYLKEEFAVIKLNKNNVEVDQAKVDEEIARFVEMNKDEIFRKASEYFKDNIFLIKEQKLQIKNPILLLKHVETLNINVRQKHIFTKISKHFEEMSQQAIFLVLYYNFFKEVNNIIGRCINLDVSYKLEFKKFNPNVYHEVVEKSKNDEVDVGRTPYLFEIRKFNNTDTKQPLDSANESKLALNLRSYLEILSAKIWAKNPTNSNVYGEYLDDEQNECRSYFDFVVKFNNGNYIYIEVKGGENSDINKDKTELLEKAYTNYFQNMENDLSCVKVVICLAKIKNNIITESYFYNKNQINQNFDGTALSKVLEILAR